MAISVGSVEVDVLPNTQGIQRRLQQALVPPASAVGDEVGRIIGRQMAAQIAAAIRNGVTTGGRTALPAAARQGDETGGAFSRSLKARLEAAFRSLPKADVRLSTTGFDADMARLRARLETLSGKRIGIDVDAATALAEITDVEARLRRLGAEHPNVQVRADTAAALAQLAALRAEVDAVDGKRFDATLDLDTSGAMSAIFQLTVALAGVAAIPAIPVLGAGLGLLASSSIAAGAGVGALAAVAIPAFSGIKAALTAQTAAQQASSSATAAGGQSNSQAAQKALQMAGAQQALATAERNGAQQIAAAQQQVKTAKQGVADAIVQAGQRTKQAEQQVEQAETSLAQAQKAAKQAQLDLVAARQEATRQLQDMNNQLVDSRLSERDAALQVQEAQQNLNAVNAAGSKATALQRQQAQLQYDEAVQHLKEQQTATKRQVADTAAANKAGVKGSQTYTSAQDKLTQAQQNVTAQTRALKDAQANQAQVQVQNARSIADAQAKVATAEKNVATAQQNAADSIASAQRQIQSAQLSTTATASKAETAQDKYRAALAKLSPATRQTLNAFVGLRTAFKAWSVSLQPQVMPLFTRALIGIKNALPGLTPLVLAAAKGISILQDRISAGFKSAAWKSLKADIAGAVLPSIVGLGTAFLNVFKGLGGIIDAFLPHVATFAGGMQRVTGEFAKWGAGLKGSPAFERFLAYASQQAPVLAHALGQVFTAFFQVSKALAPLSGPALAVFTALANGVGWLAVHMPGLVQLFYGLYVATRLATLAQVGFNVAMAVYRAGVILAVLLTQGWTAAIVAANLAFDANPIVIVVGIIIAALALLVLSVVYAWNHFSWFRNGVLAVWHGIQTAALFAWNTVLKPVFDAIVVAVQAVGRWALWLWTNILGPVFKFIGEAARILLTAVVVIALLPIIAVIKVLGAIGKWLWGVFGPIFGWIGDKAVWLYQKKIKPAFDLIVAAAKIMWQSYLKPTFAAIWGGMQTVGGWATWLYQKKIKPAWDAIVSVIKTAYAVSIKPVFEAFHTVLKGLGGWFGTAVGAIKTQWDKLKGIARAPVQFVVDTVYNNGIRGVWNKVASAFGAPKLPKYTFASGGIMPGYTPGKDVHQFISPTGGTLGLSGGEAIMRPEFTRGVGSGFVNYFNRIAKSQGAQGVKAALAPVFGGNPKTSTDTSLKYAGGGIYPKQSFANGGIFGWIGKGISAVSGAGTDVWNAIKKGASWLGDTLESSARAGVKNVVNPLLKNFPGMDTGFGAMIRNIPNKIIDAMFGYSKKADTKGAGGLGGPRIQAALTWAKTQNGKPYQWGGNGNPSWDCSGFMSAIESVIRGQKPHRRWATGSFSGRTAPPGWVYHGDSAFKIGVTNAGVGHTAGTLGKTNVESSGGAGVHMGPSARGYNNSLFPSWYGFQPGKYDSGGYLQPGLNLAYNGTGKPEPVFTAAQANALSSLAHQAATQQLGDLHVKVFVGNEQITDIARTEVHNAQGELISVLNAS